jgi:hypothetical protein
MAAALRPRGVLLPARDTRLRPRCDIHDDTGLQNPVLGDDRVFDVKTHKMSVSLGQFAECQA